MTCNARSGLMCVRNGEICRGDAGSPRLGLGQLRRIECFQHKSPLRLVKTTFAPAPSIMSGMARTSPDVDTEKQQDEYSGLTGPRIRCPLCYWMPRKDDLWWCNCGHSWNTFDTGGVCPACLRQWTETQCKACSLWSAHSAWYESD